MANIKNAQDTIRAYITDAAIALVLALIVALILGSLSAAGVITMVLAKFLLFLAWVVGLGGSFLGGEVWKPAAIHRSVFLVILGLFLWGVYLYEFDNQPAPVNAAPLIVLPSTGFLTGSVSNSAKTILQGASPLSFPPADAVSDITAYGALTNVELKESVNRNAKSLKTFNSDYYAKLKNFLDQPVPAGETQQQQQEFYVSLQKTELKMQKQFIQTFATEYLITTRALVDEMLTRLALPQPVDIVNSGLSDDGRVALDDGVVEHKNALPDLANWMIALSNLLPQK